MVTGGAGFIGSHLVDALVSKGCRVAVLDNLSSGYRENLSARANKITFIEGDIRDEKVLAGAVSGCEVIFHLAAEIYVSQTIEDPIKSAEINTVGTLRVLEAARQNGVPRVVLSSSCAVYGNPDNLPIPEYTPAKPTSPYAVQKLTGEHYAAVYSDLHGLETVSLRYFNVFGPRQDATSPYSGVISLFMKRALEKKKPVFHGDGDQSRDFIFVDDIVVANLAAARQEGIFGDVFNIGTGRQTTIKQLWEEISRTADIDLAPDYEPARKGDIRVSVADVEHTEQKLGFRAKTSLEEGLAKTYDWYLSKL